jgi:stage V sporulation protein B
MGAFPLALTKLVSSYEAKGDRLKIKALRKASKRLFLIVGLIGLAVMLILAKPYSTLISSSPKSVYTILALTPSVFFCCLGASHRAFAEGFLDMKATAISQTIEALFKMIFGLLFARYSMSALYEDYLINGSILGISVSNEEQALSTIYPITSACAMLGVTLGSIIAYLFAMIYTNSKYNDFPKDKVNVKSAYNELLAFSASLVGATVVQSIANFVDTSSIQYFLSLCDESYLAKLYSYSGDDVYTYVFGIFATVLDFKNLVPSIVMALGVTAVPTLSTAYENSDGRFSSLLSSIFKYAVVLSVAGGLILSLFSSEILNIFYSNSNVDIVNNGSKILFYMGTMILPCSLASVVVYSSQALGFAKSTIPVFAISCAVRVAVNYLLITQNDINIIGSIVSNFVGFLLIVVINIAIIKKKTNAKISYINAFVKPVICGTVVYFLMYYVKNNHEWKLFQMALLIPSCLLLYLVVLIITKTIALNMDKVPKS